MPVDITHIRQISFCADLPEQALVALAAMAITIVKPANTVLFLEGDPAPGMFVVLAGRVKLTRASAAGREQVLHIVTTGQHFNSVPVFDRGVCPANAETLVDTTLLLMPGDGLRNTILQHPPIGLALLTESGTYLRRLVRLVDDLALHTVQGRLARLLLTQASATAHGETPAITQADMAARIGTVREMVSRTLKTFEALGLIHIERGVIVVLDREGLQAQAEE
jgi:CRP-like cAMP-binding protein